MLFLTVRFLPLFPVVLRRRRAGGQVLFILLASAEQLGQLSGYIAELLQEMAGELRRGSIQADPWYRSSSEGACVYCSYFDACRFDETRDKPRYKTNLKAPEFWKKLEERRDKECP